MRESSLIQEIGNCSDDPLSRQHADVDGLNLEVGDKLPERIRDDRRVNRLHSPHALGGLDGQRRNAGDAVTLMGSYGFDVGGNSRPGRRIKTRDRQNNWGWGGHRPTLTERCSEGNSTFWRVRMFWPGRRQVDPEVEESFFGESGLC